LWGVAIVVVGALTGDVALVEAQGFMVKPMIIEIEARPGQTLEQPLQIRNTSIDGPGTVDVRLVELVQKESGSWRYLELDTDADMSDLASCVSWVSLSAKNVEIAPASPATLDVRFAVPAQARGAYFAGVIVRPPVPERPESGVRSVTQFLIPLVVRIKGPAEKQELSFEDPFLEFVEDRNAANTTKAGFVVSNDGRTFPRVAGAIRVARRAQDRWFPVANVEIEDVGIIPGSTLTLQTDLERRLPSGLYKLSLMPVVDGRRLRPVESEVEFEGDPNVTELAVDSSLMVDPTEVTLEIAPGASRTAVVAVENLGDRNVLVETASMVPPALESVQMNGVRGTDLSCAEWLQVAPSRFTLSPGRRQNFRISARAPEDEMQHAAYFANISLQAGYLDGQSAGETRILVAIENQRASAAAAAVVEYSGISRDRASKYVVEARVANTGDVHFAPLVRGNVLTGQGQVLQQFPLNGDPGSMVPMEKRTFSGVVDCSDIEPGNYLLQIEAVYRAGEAARREMTINVSAGTSGKVVTVR
jgi:hypothetical protein